MVVCIPATDLDNSLREAKKFRDLLAKLPPDEFELFQKIVMRREFEAVLEDGGVLPDKPPDPPTSPPLYKLMSDIAKDESLRSYVTRPLMQESLVARLNYLRRVWPKTAPPLKAAL